MIFIRALTRIRDVLRCSVTRYLFPTFEMLEQLYYNKIKKKCSDNSKSNRKGKNRYLYRTNTGPFIFLAWYRYFKRGVKLVYKIFIFLP